VQSVLKLATIDGERRDRDAAIIVSRPRHKNEQFVIRRILLLHPQLIALHRQSGVSFKAH
jgi:hypothetical protein